MDNRHAFARHVFFWAAIYGIAVLLPMYFLEARLGRDFPPPASHPEHYYGFIGVVLALQFAFLAISRDVARCRRCWRSWPSRCPCSCCSPTAASPR